MLVIKLPNPALMFVTTSNSGIPLAIPTKNELKINAKNGCTFSFAVATTTNNTPTKIIKNSILFSPLLYTCH